MGPENIFECFTSYRYFESVKEIVQREIKKMTVEEVVKGAVGKRNVLVGIRIDSRSRELLSWALVKVAEPGDCVVAVHVCRSSGNVCL